MTLADIPGPIGSLFVERYGWDPAKHKRGQPTNKGQFGPGGGGAGVADRPPPRKGNPTFRDPAAVKAGWAKVKARLLAVRNKLLELAARIDPADVLPTVDDYARITAARPNDPLRAAIGIPAYDAAVVFTHAVAWAITRAKKKLAERKKPETYAADAGDVKAELLALFREFVGEATSSSGEAGPTQPG